MSVFVVIRCDTCNAKVGHGESVSEARRDARTYGADRIDGADLCEICKKEEA